MGALTKTFAVVGMRIWQFWPHGLGASGPLPFEVMPIGYDRAFGGVDTHDEDPARHAACVANPVGQGFHRQLRRAWVEGSPLPNTEEIDRPVTRPDGDYAPMAFGPLGRAWTPRAQYAGTYDQRWLDEDFPFLPADFDARYFQSAPIDQQLDAPLAGQEVALFNLTPDGRRRFMLPAFQAPVHVFPRRGAREDLEATLDTLLLEPDQDRLTLTWRVTRALRRDLFEIAQVVVGRPGQDWWQAREEIAFPIPLGSLPDTEPETALEMESDPASDPDPDWD